MTQTIQNTVTDLMTMTLLSTIIQPTTYVSVYTKTSVIDNVRSEIKPNCLRYSFSRVDQDD